MAPSQKAPRMSQFVVATCIALRRTGLSLRTIAAHPLVKKRDGKPPTQQSVREALLTHKTSRKSAQWALNGAGKRRLGGRGKKISKDEEKEMVRLIKKNPGLVRAPQLKKTLKLRCTVRTVQRTVASLGYKVYRRGPKKVLPPATKKRRVQWAEDHKKRTRTWWRNRGFTDGHYWYLAWSRSHAATVRVRGSTVLRRKGQGKAPKRQGAKSGGYKQGRRVGVWGVLTRDGLRVIFLPKGRLTGATHATTVRKKYGAWAGWTQGVVHDGERALWAPAAKAAYTAVGVPALKHPPRSPDLNPIENIWARLDDRLDRTAPNGFETEKKFMGRVRAAMRHLNTAKLDELKRTVNSMPTRVQEVLKLKGGMTKY